jgi:hypothetical protein
MTRYVIPSSYGVIPVLVPVLVHGARVLEFTEMARVDLVSSVVVRLCLRLPF